MTTSLDDVLDKLSLADKLELVRRVRVGSLLLRDGDRVAAGRRLRGSYVDEDLEAEGEDCRVPYDVPAGTLGRVIRVRQYVTPFPYGVAFDNGVDLSLAVGDVVRVAEQPSERERERDGALWHIPPGELFTIRCSRWIDRVGRACPQLRLHQGPCGLPPQ
ncbi:hypothetical protein OG252_52060 (plasmid) [Streptomyces sp. NBC_01352]|uniref:hypothetical protein n=1 Tax=Streptomyces sp. NBC_01352 TaxID=2903834 RepID=UPI002E30FF5A|nr:hypothetical protein [Streptomyces sp. NBC_01352]